LTPGDGIARIIRTNIAIVAVQRWSTHARTSSAGISRGAGITVITGCRVVGIDAAGNWITAIGCTNITIVTVQRRSTDTDSGRTGICRGAGIAVVTGCCVVGIDTATYRITRIIRTNITIVTVQRWSTHARTSSAGISRGTGVAVVT
jgi:hypothetical protein